MKKNFEKSLKRLEEITGEMEKNETSIDKVLNLYKEGVTEATFCAEFLQDIEQEVLVLQKNAEGIFKLNKFYDIGDE